MSTLLLQPTFLITDITLSDTTRHRFTTDFNEPTLASTVVKVILFRIKEVFPDANTWEIDRVRDKLWVDLSLIYFKQNMEKPPTDTYGS